MNKSKQLVNLARQTGRQNVITALRRATMEDRSYSRDEIWEMLNEISMGMSGDLEDAVAEGSTMVRIGTDLFGPRPPRETN